MSIEPCDVEFVDWVEVGEKLAVVDDLVESRYV